IVPVVYSSPTNPVATATPPGDPASAFAASAAALDQNLTSLPPTGDDQPVFQLVPEPSKPDQTGTPDAHSDESIEHPLGNVASLNSGAPDANIPPPAFLSLQDRPILFNVLNDQKNFYRCASLEWLAVGLGGAAILANTHADQGFRDAYGET